MATPATAQQCAPPEWLPDPYRPPACAPPVAFSFIEDTTEPAPPPLPDWAQEAEHAINWGALIALGDDINDLGRLLLMDPGRPVYGTSALVVTDETLRFAATLQDTLMSAGFQPVPDTAPILTGTVMPRRDGPLDGMLAMAHGWWRAAEEMDIPGPGPPLAPGTDFLLGLLIIPEDAGITDPDEDRLVSRQMAVLATAASFDLFWSADAGDWYPSPFPQNPPGLVVAVCREPTASIEVKMARPDVTVVLQRAGAGPPHLTAEGMQSRMDALPSARRRWLREWLSLHGSGEHLALYDHPLSLYDHQATLCALEMPDRWHAPRSRPARSARRALTRITRSSPAMAGALNGEILSLLPPLRLGLLAETHGQVMAADDRSRARTAPTEASGGAEQARGLPGTLNLPIIS